jgi:hypothetical protein
MPIGGTSRRWRYGDLNPRPMACKATALATELYPQEFVKADASVVVDLLRLEENQGREGAESEDPACRPGVPERSCSCELRSNHNPLGSSPYGEPSGFSERSSPQGELLAGFRLKPKPCTGTVRRETNRFGRPRPKPHPTCQNGPRRPASQSFGQGRMPARVVRPRGKRRGCSRLSPQSAQSLERR